MSVESFTARHPRYFLTFIVVSLVFILFHVISPHHPRPPPFDSEYCGRMTGWEHPPHHWGPPPPGHDGRPSAWGPPPEHRHHHDHKPFWGPPPDRHDAHAEGMPPPPPHWHSEHGPHHNGPPPPPPHFWGPPPPGHHHHHEHPEDMAPPPAHWSEEEEHHHHHHGPPPPHFWGPPPHGHEDHGDFQGRPPRPEHFHQGPPPHRHEHHHEKQGEGEDIPQSDPEVLGCPHTMQLLGESWVCGFERIAAKEQCVVYSIGVAGESSFEGSVLKESEGCVIFGYDSKAESFGASVPADSTRAKFSVLETTQSALSTMQTNGHEFIDILKIELNDEADFDALEALLNELDGPRRRPPPYPFSGRDALVRKPRLPFGQLLLTVKSEASPVTTAIFEKIQRMGMLPFFAGPSASKDAFDYAFINIPREHKHKMDVRPDADAAPVADTEIPAPVAQEI